MSRPVVAVSMRVVHAAGYAEPRDAISHDWARWFEALELSPLLVPNALAAPEEYMRRMGAQALLLTGGNDVGRVGAEQADSPDAAPERDRTERRLLDAAMRSAMPVFAVCRGLQMVNAFFGGALVRDLREFGRHAGVTHPIAIRQVPALRDLPASASVNSFHNQGVHMSGMSSELVPFATTDDGLVEGLVHRDAPLIAVQWHPERPNPAADLDQALVRTWLDTCR